MSGRFLKLLRRSVTARRLGFGFFGTSGFQLPDSLSFRGQKFAISAPQDGGYPSDVINLWLDDEYGLRQLKASPGVVADVGANIGLFSLWAHAHFPSARVCAYEPNPRILPFLERNVAGLPVKVFRAGVGFENGRAELRDDGPSRMASTRLADRGGSIEIIALRDVVARCGGSIDLLKLDCEGAEWDMFRDADSFRRVARVRMEYHLVQRYSLEDFSNCVRALGFSIKRLVPNQGFGIAWLDRIGKH